MNLRKIPSKLKNNAPFVLCVAASLGTVATAISAAKQTPKAMELLDRCRECNCSRVKTAIVVAPIYLPTAGFAVGTILCIFGANHLNKKQQAALISAYKLAETSFKDYRSKVKEIIGEDKEREIQNAIAMDDFTDYQVPETEDPLFYDEFCKEYFNLPQSVVQEAAYKINRHLAIYEFASLNDYRNYLGLPPVDGGDEIGWSLYTGPVEYGYDWLDFEYTKMDLEDGMECYSIYYQPPHPNYI